MKELSKKEILQKNIFDITVICVYLGILFIILLWGRFVLESGDEIGYCLIAFYLITPVSAFVCSVLLATKDTVLKWIAPFIFSLTGGILPGLIFRSIEIIFLLVIFVPSILGIIIGLSIKKIKQGMS